MTTQEYLNIHGSKRFTESSDSSIILNMQEINEVIADALSFDDARSYCVIDSIERLAVNESVTLATDYETSIVIARVE